MPSARVHRTSYYTLFFPDAMFHNPYGYFFTTHFAFIRVAMQCDTILSSASLLLLCYNNRALCLLPCVTKVYTCKQQTTTLDTSILICILVVHSGFQSNNNDLSCHTYVTVMLSGGRSGVERRMRQPKGCHMQHVLSTIVDLMGVTPCRHLTRHAMVLVCYHLV